MKSTLYKVVLLNIFIGISLINASAQGTYNGYVITNENDTISGIIELGSYAFRTVRITFTDYETRQPEQLEPFQIRSFHANGQTYDSKVYDIDEGLDYGYAVFMERIESGFLTLYKYWNNNRRKFEMILEGNDKKMTLVKKRGFRKQMTSYFKDHQLIKAKLIRNIYKYKHLSEMVKIYNDSKDKVTNDAISKKSDR